MHAGIVGFAWTAGPRVPILRQTLGAKMSSGSLIRHSRYSAGTVGDVSHELGLPGDQSQTLSGARGAKKECQKHFGGQINKNFHIHLYVWNECCSDACLKI